MKTHLALSLVTLLALPGCKTLSGEKSAPCQGQDWVETTFYLGRSVSTPTDATKKTWKKFVSAEVTSRFPDGFTIFDARGAWRNRMFDTTIYEHTKVLVILHDGTDQSKTKIGALAHAYRTTFNQEAVLAGETKSCVTFYTAP